ncbi:MAG: hypothetical protein R2744_11965 [Bacteroidales bacterium]
MADNVDGHTRDLIIDPNSAITTQFNPDLLNGTETIKLSGWQSRKTVDGDIELGEMQEINLIPYHLWANRGPGEMLVWLPYEISAATPLAAPAIANKSRISASKETKALRSITDQYEPLNSNDHTNPYYHWWPDNNRWEYIQYDFEKPETISSSRVYWFDDGPDGGCRIPAQWELLYRNGSKWIKIVPESGYTITRDGWDAVNFEPIITDAVRLRVLLPVEFSSGVHEWEVK